MAAPLLNVAHLTLRLDVGGLERNIVNQVRQAPLTGENVSVICLERPGSLAPAVQDMGARVVSAEKKPGLCPAIVLRLRRIIRELRPDVIHSHQVGPLFYLALLGALGVRLPLVVHTEHGREPYPASRRLRALARFAAQQARVFYCLTQDMADHVLASRITSREKIRLIHNGIDFSAYSTPRDTAAVRAAFGIPDDAPLIGTIGRLNEIKRQDVLLQAFALVRQQVPSAHLLLVGDGPLLGDLKQLARVLNVADGAHFAGYQSDTAPYMQAMNVFALTSRSEGMPQSLLEACVAAVPSICSRVGGIPEVIDHGRTGLLFEPGNHAALASGLIELLRDRSSARAIASAAQAHVQSRYSIQRMALEYHEHFLDLLGRPVGRLSPATPTDSSAAPRACLVGPVAE